MSRTVPLAYSSVATLILLAVPLPYLLRFDHGHTLTAGLLALALAALTVRSRSGGIVALLTFLVLLGDYRRLCGMYQGYPASDPLLLVAPLMAIVLVFLAVVERRWLRASGLALTIALLGVLMVAEIFNPEQGGMAVGIAGALFYIVPLLWFWVGRSYGDSQLLDCILSRLLPAVGLIAALLGIYQSLHGLLPFEAAWVDAVQYEALYVSADVVRAFGFFTSGAEYTRFLLICCAVIIAYGLTERSRWIWTLPVFLAALFLASSRGPIVALAATAVTLWAVRARRSATWMPRWVVAGFLAGAMLFVALYGLQQARFSHRVDILLSHQVEGLLDPTNAEKSTAVGHLQLGAEAIVQGIASVAGKGLGATTLAASKYGNGVYSAEMDFANMFYSLGALGGMIYAVTMAMVLWKAFGLWRAQRSALSMALLALLVSTAAAWLLGGEYSIAAIVWLAIGALDREHVHHMNRVRTEAHAYRHRHA